MTDKSSALLLANSFKQAGGSSVVISPGSRNAPLMRAFQETGIHCYSIVDERCASFFAMGLAYQKDEMVGVICTSGTALLNYAPAVAESFYQGIPLVVFSADRPLEWIDTGQGQSIRQENVFANFQKGFMHLPEFMRTDSSEAKEMIDLLQVAQSDKKGPVHFNLPFSEPLYGSAEFQEIPDFDVQREERITAEWSPKAQSDFQDANRILLLCGMLDHKEDVSSFVNKLAGDERFVILTESTSNIRSNRVIQNIDRILPGVSDKSFDPDLVITLGEHIVSKRIKQWLKAIAGLKHFHINAGGLDMDTFGVLEETISMRPSEFLDQLTRNTNVASEKEWVGQWNKLNQLTREAHEVFINRAKYSDLKAFELILEAIPEGYHLESANSSIVRYIQLFEQGRWKSFHANRGTSGIDGSTSTALGIAASSDSPIVFVSGDISFFYDSNAFWNNYIPATFRCIVVNNGGGGIFRYIPGPRTVENFETYFETQHTLEVEKVCDLYNMEYLSAGNLAELEKQLDHFFNPSDKPVILEIITPREENPDVLNDYFRFIKEFTGPSNE